MGGVGININIIALIALDRGDARAYDTLQITRRGSGARRVAERGSAREEEQRERRARVGYVGSIVTYPRATT